MSITTIIRGMRLGKAVGLIVALVLFALWWIFFADPGEPTAVRAAPGVIAEVHERAYLVRLDSGERVRVFRTVEAPAGARVVLTATRHASGTESFVLAPDGVRGQ